MRRGDLRRLERLETPTRADYAVTRRRAFAWTLRAFGAELEEREEADLEGYGGRFRLGLRPHGAIPGYARSREAEARAVRTSEETLPGP